MHGNGIIYNDLKADNLLLIDGRIKFSDFDTCLSLKENQLSYSNLSKIRKNGELLNAQFIITDPLLYDANYVGDIITTPSISAPETKLKQNIFVGTASDIW